MAMAAAASSERVLRSAAPATSATVPFDTMYINLDRRTDRRKSMESRLAAAGLSQWERVPARTGKETPPSRVCTEWDARLNHQFDTNCAARVYRFSDGERGCAMSHVLLWERVAARENEGRPVLVLEDDAVLDGRNSVAIISSLVALIERSAMPSQRVRTPYTDDKLTLMRASLTKASRDTFRDTFRDTVMNPIDSFHIPGASHTCACARTWMEHPSSPPFPLCALNRQSSSTSARMWLRGARRACAVWAQRAHAFAKRIGFGRLMPT